MRILAFQGTRYSDRNDEPGRFAAPPYDQIDDALRDRLQADPLSFAHLLRPVAPAGSDPFEHAASLHEEWSRSGIVETDEAASLYPYEIDIAGGGRRLGLTALVGVEPPSSGVIRPHERTVDKTVEERLQLLRAMRTDLGPVLLLSEDGGNLDSLLATDIDSLAPLVEHRDLTGNVHRLYRVLDAERIGAYRALLEPCAGLIADGHHRYKVARLYSEEISAAAGTAPGAKLAVITSLASSGLSIDPIHRGLLDPVGLDSPCAAVLERHPSAAASGVALAAAVAATPQPAIGLLGTGQAPEIWTLDPDTGPTDLPPAASQLAVVLLHSSVFPGWGLEADAAVDGTVKYRSDPDVLFDTVASGRMACGFFLPPMETSGFSGAIAKGDILPPKSTRFLPKLVSGLVWSGHDAGTR